MSEQDPVKPSEGADALKELREKPLGTNRAVLWALFQMIRQNRKWWLMPIFLVLSLLSLFVSLTGTSSVLPAIYALF